METLLNRESDETEATVYERYAAAARAVEPALCCPVEYAADFLAVIPEEIIERDYGCGDPTGVVRPGETVLDLGSGTGKLCYVATQIVGREGRVIGVDCNREMLEAFEQAGFHGIQIVKRQREPWQTIDGIEFRSVTVVAHKGKQGPCLERKQAVIYRGPFKTIEDDDGHVFFRGERMAVCDKTFRLLQQKPYTDMFEAIEPRQAIPPVDAQPFPCRRNARRPARETKGEDYSVTTESHGPCCGDDGACC